MNLGIYRPAIKICGIKTLSDALAAIDAGANLLGFNFYPKSPRFIEVRDCAEITAVLNANYPGVRRVGVFVDAPVAEIQAILRACSLDMAQLHGDEPPEALAQLSPNAFKAFRGIPADASIFPRTSPPAFLVDASVKGTYGGTGVTADWSLAARLSRRFPLLLAGGLNPDNVAEAVRQVRPWGVDVASGVESRPGVKDAGRMRAFVQAVRSVSESESGQDSISM